MSYPNLHTHVDPLVLLKDDVKYKPKTANPEEIKNYVDVG